MTKDSRRKKCQTEFCVQSATAKERAPALLVVALANCRSRVSTLATATNVTAVANGVAMYVGAVARSNHLLLSLLFLQALPMSTSRVVSLGKRKGVKGGRAVAQQSRPLTRRSRAFEVILTFYVRCWPKADMPKNAIYVAIGVKRTWAVAPRMSAYDPKRTLDLGPTRFIFTSFE